MMKGEPPQSCQRCPWRTRWVRQQKSRGTQHPIPALWQVGTAGARVRIHCPHVVCSFLVTSKVTVTLSESSHQVLWQTQISEQKAGTGWESAPNACEQAARLISLLALLCQLITGLSGTLMHAALMAIQLSSLLRMSYQQTCSYTCPGILQRCKELSTGDGFCSRHATQANSTAKKPLLVGAVERLCLYFGGLWKAHRQDGEMHFRENRKSRQRAEGKQKMTLVRGHSEEEK